jgi:hypothetical protein
MIQLDELAGFGFAHAVDRLAVFEVQFDPSAQETTRCVDLVDDHVGDVGIGDAHDGQRAGLLGDYTYPDRLIVHVVQSFQ